MVEEIKTLIDAASYSEFNYALGTWNVQIETLHQNLEQLESVIGMNFVHALKPVVKVMDEATSHVVSFAKTISSALGNIFGWTYEEGSEGFWQDFEGAETSAGSLVDDTGKIAKNINRVKNSIRAFDELKTIGSFKSDDFNITEGKGSGGGSGASAGKWVPGKSFLKYFESEIDSLKELGNYIGSTITQVLRGIDWDFVYEGARNFGSGLAQFLNGLISPGLFGEVGSAIAGALNTVVYAALALGEEIDFINIGASIAAGINRFFKAADVKALAQTISVWVRGALNAASVLLRETDFQEMGRKIGSFLANLDTKGAAKDLAEVLWEVVKGGFTLLKTVYQEAPLETALIAVFSLLKFTKVGNVIKATLTSVLRSSLTEASMESIKSFGTKFKEGAGKAITAGLTAFAEFSVVTDAFRNLMQGADDLLFEIGKIGGVVGVAGAAFTATFGFPNGLVAAGIVGVAGAIKGMGDALESIRAEEIGTAIKDAMSNPGGVPLSEVTSEFAASLSEAASGFDAIRQNSSELDSVQGNIRGVWLEIEKIETAMENGVISIEEGKAKLDVLFSELATLTEQKFSGISNTLLAAYGENGTLVNVYEKCGKSTEEMVDTIISFEYKNVETVKKLIEEMSGLDPASEIYKEKRQELALMSSEMDEFMGAASNFTYDMNSLQGRINYDEIFPNGELDSEVLKRYLDEASIALTNYENIIDESAKELRKDWMEVLGSTQVSEEEKAVAQAALDFLPEAINQMKTDAQAEITQFTDMIQYDFISRTGEVITNAQEEWNGKDILGKIYSGMFGVETESEYIKEALEKHQENVMQLTSVLQESFGIIEEEGAFWAGNAANEIYGTLFDSTCICDALGRERYVYALKENYEELIYKGLNGVPALMDRQGKGAIDGYIKGITGYKGNTIRTLSEYFNGIAAEFSGMESPFQRIGVNMMQGLLNGLSSMEDFLYIKSNKIAGNIATCVRMMLGINSPSKVMFELGEYTMQGFQNGLENRYQPIVSSLEELGYDLQAASRPDMSDIYGNYGCKEIPYISKDGVYQQNENFSTASIETNGLLRQQNELLRAILAKPNLKNEDIFNATKTVYRRESRRRYGNSAAFDPIFG